MKRRDFFKKAGIGSAALVSLPVSADALTRAAFARSPLKLGGQPATGTFVILLDGPYKPVVHGPNLGLFQVNLSDGSYSTTKIYRVSDLPGKDNGGSDRDSHPADHNAEKENARIGNFYVQIGGSFAVYDLPGGALTMVFTADGTIAVPDGLGGTFFVGTIELDITEATGVYQSFVGGHNKMVDVLHLLADGTFVEHCFCIISRP